MTNKDFTVSVVAGGTVGSAVAAYYSGVKIYDKYKEVDKIEEVAKADYIFVAPPTPYKDGLDLTEMDDAIAQLVKHLQHPERQVVILKSTILPGTTDSYQKKYPNVNFVFNPEFLTESVAIEDFAGPDKQIVGYTGKTEGVADQVLEILPPAPYSRVVPAKSAEMAKYAINSYYAFKVIFGNSLFDFAEKVGANYDKVREALVGDKRIIDSHFDVWHGGFRGYGGKCLPKDVSTLVWFGKNNGVDVRFLEQIEKINNQLIQENE